MAPSTALPQSSAHYAHASTSRSSLDVVEPEARAAVRGDKPAVAGRSSPVPSPGSINKGKDRAWGVELAVIGPDGAKQSRRRGVEEEREAAVPVRDRAGLAAGGQQGRSMVSEQCTDSPQRPPPSADLPPSPCHPAQPAAPSPPPPPPAPEQPERPARPPLQSILKRPESTRTTSSPVLVFSAPPPSSPIGIDHPIILPSAPLTPTQTPVTVLGPPSPDSLESKDNVSTPTPAAHAHTVLFSTPGTTSSVLPLSSPSHLSHLSATTSGGAGASGDNVAPDFTGTFRSWKSSVMGRKSGIYEKKRLAELGFDEELARDYDFFASFGISLCNIGGLPGTVLGVLTALSAGGGSMYAIAWPLSGLFMMALAAVLGEMASTWPVAGAMFTWVFRLCRSSKSLNPWARYASWIVGSLLLCSHILLQIVCTWQFAHNLLGVVGLWTDKTYSYWVIVAICWGILTFSALIVSSRVSRSPWLWRICGALIIVFFLIINITLLTTADEIFSAKYVFTSYRNTTGFSSKSYVYMLGWVLTCVATGMEASAHMAEDTKRPSRTVPLAMFWSVAATYIMGWISICVLLATMRTDGADPDLQPSIALIANSIPRKYTTVILVLVLLSFLFQNVAQLLATSRFIWALARESALPFSAFFRRLSSKNRTPTNAIWAVWAISFPAMFLLAINVSIIATMLLEGAGITATMSYVAPLLLYLACPADVLRGDGRAKWTLRRASKALALPAAVFLLVFICMMSLPTGYPVTELNASYASAILVGVLLLSSLAWILYGNAHYAGPIKTTTRWTIGAEVDLPGGGRAKSAKRSRRKSAAAVAAAPPGSSAARTGTGPGAGAESSAEHGRSAHVWATSGAGGADSAAWTRGTDLSAVERTGETTGSMGSTGTGESGWSEYTSDGEGSTVSEDIDDDDEPSRSRSRARPADEEHRIS
ncbi:hypothetical protein JCM3770_001993 [Rhodotorula araucariae]